MCILMYNSVQCAKFWPNYIFNPTLSRWINSLFPFYLNIITINIPVKLVDIIYIYLPYMVFCLNNVFTGYSMNQTNVPVKLVEILY